MNYCDYQSFKMTAKAVLKMAVDNKYTADEACRALKCTAYACCTLCMARYEMGPRQSGKALWCETGMGCYFEEAMSKYLDIASRIN